MDVWSAVLPLAGAVLGFAGATHTTARQLSHDRQMQDLQLKRETFRAFFSAGVSWSDTVLIYGSSLTAAIAGRVEVHWERQNEAWKNLNDAYSLLLLVASPETVHRVKQAFVPTRDSLMRSVESGMPDPALVAARSLELKRALSGLLNAFRTELGEDEVIIATPVQRPQEG